MLSNITRIYTAKNLTANIRKINENCKIRIKNKSRRKAKYGFMSNLGPAEYLFKTVPIDTIGGF